MKLTIIMPIHNGERSLGSTIASLEGQLCRDVRLVLVLNGCADASPEIARVSAAGLKRTGAEVLLLESPQASRAAALNTGDAYADGHRLYLDQDAVLSSGAVPQLLATLESGFHYAAAAAKWRTSSSLVQWAMTAWNRSPYVREQVVTAGAYAVSMQGRSRWSDWPEGLPDDKYARLHFDLHERTRVEGATYEVSAPECFGDLVRARRRYLRFNENLRRQAPELLRREGPRFRALWRAPASSWGGLAVLAAAELAATVGVRR